MWNTMFILVTSSCEYQLPSGVSSKVVDELVELRAGLRGTDISQGNDAVDSGLLRVCL